MPPQPPPRPFVAYPCAWTFQVIGTSESGIREHVAALLASDEHDLSLSRSSRGGRYVSLRLRVVVTDEDHRLSLHRGLAEGACVRLVL